MLQKIVTAFKNRPFIPQDDLEPKSNLQIFEEVVTDSIKSFTKKFDVWFKNKYNFDLYAEGLAGGNIPVDFPHLFDNARILLLETDEKVFKFNEPARFKMLDEELKGIEEDYRKIPATPINMNNAPLNVQQAVPIDEKELKKNEIRLRLEEFEKKLRKLIFDTLPKKAN